MVYFPESYFYKEKMVKVEYCYLKGTNIEVGVRRVSKGGKFAKVTYRYGKQQYMHTHQWKAARKRQEASKHMEVTVPCSHLTHKMAFTQRNVIKKYFKPSEPLVAQVDLQKDLFICGAIKAHLKSYNKASGVVTFGTTPVRKAHISVLTNAMIQPNFEKRVSLVDDTSAVEYGCIKGTNIHVNMVIERKRISLYRFENGKEATWIPHEFIDSNPTEYPSHTVTKAYPIGIKYLHGFIPVDAYKTEYEHVLIRLPGDNIATSWSKKEYVHDQPTQPHLVNFREHEKDAYMVERHKRLKEIRPLI